MQEGLTDDSPYAGSDPREQDGKKFRSIGTGRPFPRERKPIGFWVHTPLLPRPDFYGMAWVVRERVVEIFGEPLEMSGEFLPITIGTGPGN